MGRQGVTSVSYSAELLCIATLLIVCACGVAHAEAVTPYSITITSSGLSDFLYSRVTKALQAPKEREKIPTIRLQGRAYGLGRFDVALTTRRDLLQSGSYKIIDRSMGAPERPILLQGSVALGGGLKRQGNTRVVPVAASIANGGLELHFESRKRGYTYLIRATLGQGHMLSGRIKKVARTVGRRGTCHSSTEDVEGLREHAQHDAGNRNLKADLGVAAVTRIITLSTDADTEWYQRYGTESFAKIAQIVNTAEALYFQPLGIGFSIHAQHVYTDSCPYTSSDAGGLLEQFLKNRDNPKNLAQAPDLYYSTVDTKHLFTGKDLDGSAVGIAYVGSVCRYPGLAFGLSQDTHAVVAPAVFAHEIAHNIGAFHDVASPGSLMYPSLIAGSRMSFSSLSVGQIEEYLANNSACLDLEDRQATPLPTEPVVDLPGDEPPGQDGPEALELTISVREMRSNQRLLVVRGRLTRELGVGVATRLIELRRNRRVAATKGTNVTGRVSFVIARRNTRALSLATKVGETVSKTIGVAGEIR